MPGRRRRKSKVQKTKEHYFSVYQSWGKVHCPALGKDILFTNWGWDHISQIKKRTRREKIERLKLLPLAKKLLETTTTVQGKRFQDYHDHYEFIALMDGTKIRVLVVEDKKKYYFYSVFKV